MSNTLARIPLICGNRLRNKTTLVLLLLAATQAVMAAEVINLWPDDQAPYYKSNSLAERETEVWNTVVLENVTRPTVTIFAAQGENSGFGVLIIPGGNYSVVAIHHEGYDVAQALSAQGITAAVLKYRLPNPLSSDQPGLVPLSDSRRALKIMHQQAARYGIDPKKIGVMGFSAGSHLATVTSLWRSADEDENADFSALIYGVSNFTGDNLKWLEESLYFRPLTAEEKTQNTLLDLINANSPPAFLVHAYDDQVCKVEESTLYAQKMFEHHVPVELHVFARGGHGFGLGRKEDGTDQWLNLFTAWLRHTIHQDPNY